MSDPTSTAVEEPDDLVLAGEFPAATEDDWLRGVHKILAGRGGDELTPEQFEAKFERVLVTRLHDGFDVPPLHTRDSVPDAAAAVGLPGRAPFVRGATAAGSVRFGWDIRQPLLVDTGDVDATNEAALDELENGATSLLLRLPADGGADADALSACLDGVHLDLITIALDTPALAPSLVELWDRRRNEVADARFAGALALDPIGRSATAPDELDDRVERMWPLVDACADRFPGVRPIAVDGRPYHDAGASDVEELAVAVATGVAYLRLLEDHGVAPAEATALLEFRVVATADQFSTIAKMRAARRLWARVAEEVGVGGPDAGAHIHAPASRAMLTRYDPWVNLLRGTVAAMAAGVGGADAVTVEAYDVLHHSGRPSPLGRRMARNTQSILVEESHLARVVDPGGGSYYLEWLTDELARHAWAWFQEIEAAGGAPAALRSGLIADRISATWDRRAEAIAHRRDPITGVSEFPNVHEEVPADDSGALGVPVGPLSPRRRAEPFEELRARCDAVVRATGQRPVVILAEIGTPADSTARSTFAKNLFEAGGLETIPWRVDDGDAALRAVVDERGPVLGCLCSTDGVYAERGEEVADALRAVGVSRVHLAGKVPDGLVVDEVVSMGCDVLAVLRAALDEAEVP